MMHAVSVYQPEEQDQQQQEEQEKIYEQQQQQEHEKILEQQQQKEREKILEQQKQEEHEKILEQQKQLEREMILEQERQQHEEHEKAEEKEQEQEQEHKQILEQQQEEEQEMKQEQDVTEPVTTTEGPEEYIRNMSVFIRPLEDTILAEPEPGPCSARRLINLVVVVMSAPGNFLERSTIRRTWGEEVLQYPGVTLFFLLGRDRNDSLHVSFNFGISVRYQQLRH